MAQETVTVVTTMGPKGVRVYGDAFMGTFQNLWGTPLRFFYDGPEQPPWIYDNIDYRRLQRVDGYADFCERHRDRYKPGVENYRCHLVHWCHKMFAMTATPYPETEWLVFLDGDVTIHRRIDQAFHDKVLPIGKSLVYLDRPWGPIGGKPGQPHVEMGFVAFRLSDPDVRHMLDEMREDYQDDVLLGYAYPNDAHVFDANRYLVKAARHHDLVALAGLKDSQNPWPETALAAYMIHNKGPKRKRAAYGSVAE